MIRKSKITALSAVTLVSLIISFQVFAQPLSKFDREVLESTDTRSSKIDFDFYNINQTGAYLAIFGIKTDTFNRQFLYGA